jgi:hypothetical protein
MSTSANKKMTIAGAYYDEVKKAIVLRGELEGVKSEFQVPMHESDFTFPPHCISKEAEMKKTAELFNKSKGKVITVQFDGGVVNGGE